MDNNSGKHRLNHVDANGLSKKIGRKGVRHRQSHQDRSRSIWHGFGLFGLIGWSVGIPILIGIAIGLWIDNNLHSYRSWTLTLFFVGLFIGLFNAWYWITREREIIEEEIKKTEGEDGGNHE